MKKLKESKAELRGKKKLMYEALIKSLGNITVSAKVVGIDRRTHYSWIEKDPLYKAYISDLDEVVVDFAENSLLKKIREGNTSCIIFYLKTKGKHRGYVERQELEHSGGAVVKGDIRVEVVKVEKKEDEL